MSADQSLIAGPALRIGALRQLCSLSWPLLISSLASLLSGVIDVAVMGHTSAEALAGVSAANAIFAVTLTICQPLGSAHQITAARSFGCNDAESVRVSLGIALRSGLIIGCAVSATLMIVAPFALAMTTSGAIAAAEGTVYLRVRAVELLFFMPFVLLTGTLTSAKMTRPGMWAMIAANLANVTADILLVLVCGLGGLGCAVGNVSGCMVAVAILLVAFRRRTEEMRLGSLLAVLRSPATRRRVLEFHTLAWPLGVSSLLDNVGALVVFGAVGHADAVAAANARVAYTVMFVAFVVMQSFATGGQILLGRAVHDATASANIIRTTLVAVSALAFLFTILLWVFPVSTSSIFLSGPTVVEQASHGVREMALVLPVMAVALVLAANQRARSRTATDMSANIAAVWAVQVPLAVTMITWGVGPTSVLVIAYGAYWVARLVLLVAISQREVRESGP